MVWNVRAFIRSTRCDFTVGMLTSYFDSPSTVRYQIDMSSYVSVISQGLFSLVVGRKGAVRAGLLSFHSIVWVYFGYPFSNEGP